MEKVNWPRAIEKNRDALLRIVEMLFAMAGLAQNAVLPRHLRNSILRILRPAESAVRRLIILAARGVEVMLRPASPLRGGRRSKRSDADPGGGNSKARSRILPPPGSVALRAPLAPGSSHGSRPVLRTPSRGRLNAKGLASRPAATNEPSLPLLDPLKHFHFGPIRRKAKTFPRITWIGLTDPTPIPDDWNPSPDDEIDAAPLLRRLRSLKHALDDLDKQALRLARWKARLKLFHALPHEQRGRRRLDVMRPGWPPGRRKRRIHEIDDILTNLHSLAIYAEELDSS